MKVVDSPAMAEIDRLAQERFLVPQAVLMEDAALGAYRALREKVWCGSTPAGEIVFVAGKGNNGGDALVMARRCCLEGKRELLIVLGAGAPRAGTLAATHLEILRALGVEVVDFQERAAVVRRRLARCDWIVDGLLGTGLRGEARGSIGELISAVNASRAQTVAVDVPSGLGDSFRKGYPAVGACATLTIGLPKMCLYLPHARGLCGRIHVVTGIFPVSPLSGRAQATSPQNSRAKTSVEMIRRAEIPFIDGSLRAEEMRAAARIPGSSWSSTGPR